MKRRILTSLLVIATLTLAVAQETKNADKSWLKTALEAKAKVQSNSTADLPLMTEIKRGGDEPTKIDVNIEGLDELILICSATEDGTGNDHATWADAALYTKDGEKVWLDKLPIKYKKVEGNWFRLKTNFANKPLSIGSKTFTTGVLAHANAQLIYDLSDNDYARFEAWVGIDKGAANRGSTIFKVLTTSGQEEAKELAKIAPKALTELPKLIATSLEEWLTTPEGIVEIAAVNTIAKQLKKRDFINNELARIATIEDGVQKLESYLELIVKSKEILSIQNQLEWLNARALKDAMNDFKSNKNYDQAIWQPKYDRFVDIVNKTSNFDAIYNYDKEAIKSFAEASELRREILLSNPELGFDKFVATRYHIGDRARMVEPNMMGTPPSNWSSLLSARREGFDAEIVEFSGFQSGNLSQRVVYKPKNGSNISETQLHWDAERILFSANDEIGRWQLYEVGVDGKGFEQVITPEESDVELFDATYLPNGDIIANSNIGYHGVPCTNGGDPIANMVLIDRDTENIRRLCFDQESNYNPTVMNSGRVMYTRWEYTDLMHYYSRIVFTMNPDGTEQKALYGSGSYFPNATYDMQPLPGQSTSFVGIITGHHGVIRSGRLIIFNPEKSRKEEKGMVQEIPFSKRPIIPIVKDEMVNGVWPQFVKPFPITDKYFLVSAKLTPESLWGIYLVDIYDNMLLIVETEGDGFISPIPLKERQMPPVIPSRVDLSRDDATVFIQDIYEGEGLPGVPRGTVKKLRVFTYEFAYTYTQSDHVAQGIQSGWDIKRELGEVDVNADGSALFIVPANTPIALQPLDSEGRAIQLMRSWFTGMPGETVSCVGCHEDQNMIAMPKRVTASQQKPQAIVAPKTGVRPLTFDHDIQPILDRACVACHNGEGRVPLDFKDHSMDSVMDWAGTRYYSKSYLAFHPYFYRQGPEAEMAVLNPYEYASMSSEMFQILENNHHNVELKEEEIKTLYKWLDFNVPYNNTFKAEKLKSRAGEVIDQISRRRELAAKYAGSVAVVDWQKEIDDYAKVLEAQGEIVPVMPSPLPMSNKKAPKVKNWPFSQEVAQEMVAGREPRIVELGNGEKLKFVYIPAGSYVAGGSGKGQTKGLHKVKIKKGFWMSETEITNAQMQTLIPEHDSRYVGQFWKDHTLPGYDVKAPNFAASKVSYLSAERYAQLLSAKSGFNVRLPSEEQWEWAARAGSSDDFWFGDVNTDFTPYDNLADVQLTKMAVSGIDPKPMSKNSVWYRFQNYVPKDETVDDGNMLVSYVAQYKANPWGLYDINGNVAEWTRSDFERSSDPSMIEADKVVRGGSWYERATRATVATRRNFLPWQAPVNVGFRVIIEE